MSSRKGMTLMEIIVVLIIAGVAAAFFLPNYTKPTEQARAANAWNNLLAIYSAEQNYYNNYGSYYFSPSSANDVTGINSKLSLNIQDDGTYKYWCYSGALTNNCQAKRLNSTGFPYITLYLGQAIPCTSPSCVYLNPQCCTLNNGCPTSGVCG